MRIGNNYIVAILTPWGTYIRLLKILHARVVDDSIQEINWKSGLATEAPGMNLTVWGYGSITTTPIRGGFIGTEYYQQHSRLNLHIGPSCVFVKKSFHGPIPQSMGQPDSYAVKRILKKFMKDHHRVLYELTSAGEEC